jgi:MurNAc alpha-1-phosphate uridylyltransferase
MILAAGLGERMRPLTDHTPKPMLRVGNVPLIEHHIRRLASAGFGELVINVSHLGEQIMDYCGDGSRWGVSIVYSPEEEPLETAGGIHRALPLLGSDPFLVVNGDIWIGYDFRRLLDHQLGPDTGAHLVMVGNPPQHARGDFLLGADGRVRELEQGVAGATYSGVGVYGAAFFSGMQPGRLRLRPLLDGAIRSGRLSGEFFAGDWEDVGTPERLQALDARVRSGS